MSATAALNLFNGILYINLERRKDRREALEKKLKKFSLDENRVFRIEAFDDELNGSRGCVLSHVKALDFALEKEWKNVLILEDDCTFTKNPEEIHNYISDFFTHYQNDWDVFFLGTKLECIQETNHPQYVQVRFSLRAHAYVVNGPYMVKLRDHFLSTYEAMKEDLFFVDSLSKALDRKWVDLQLTDRWFSGRELIAEQSKSYSDIEKTVKSKR